LRLPNASAYGADRVVSPLADPEAHYPQPSKHRVSHPHVDRRLAPAGTARRDADLRGKRAGLHFAIERRAAEAGPIKDGIEAKYRSGVFRVDGQSSSPFETGYIPGTSPADFDLAKRYLEALVVFEDVTSIRMAAERPSRSRREVLAVDRVADLGMALEIALTHGDGEQFGEINWRLQMRTGWLLGADPEDRNRKSKLARDLYAMRSRAVQSGKSSATADAMAQADEASTQSVD